MSIGTISTPSSWSNGTIAIRQWFTNVQDTINALIGADSSAGASSGHIVIANGAGNIKVQWSKITIPATTAGNSSTPQTVTWPIAFANTNYAVTAMSNGTYTLGYFSPITTTQIAIAGYTAVGEALGVGCWVIGIGR